VNLNFHGVGKPLTGEEEVWLDREYFCRVLDQIALSENVWLSFDDGNRSDLEIAVPELKRRGQTATFFIIADRVGKPSYLDREDLHRLLDAGMTLGSHGMRHIPWRNLTAVQEHEEFYRARAVLEDLTGTEVLYVACPFGSYERRSLKAVREAGYERVFTSDGGLADEGAWLQPRNSIWSSTALSEVTRLCRREISRWEQCVTATKQLMKRLR
jgi:peptidoglycan/xylan/chitin deacetylase (PgdA/CDA1 family)